MSLSGVTGKEVPGKQGTTNVAPEYGLVLDL